MERLESSEFTWSRWRGGSVLDVLGPGLRCREADIISPHGKSRILALAVGYCEAERVPCRPKVNNVAVMFFSHGGHFWFHLRNREFRKLISIAPLACTQHASG